MIECTCVHTNGMIPLHQYIVMSTRPGPVDEDSSSCLSGGEGEGAVSQEDYVKLRNMINKQIIDPLQEADHHQQQG